MLTTGNSLFQVLPELPIFPLIPMATFFCLVQTFPNIIHFVNQNYSDLQMVDTWRNEDLNPILLRKELIASIAICF